MYRCARVDVYAFTGNRKKPVKPPYLLVTSSQCSQKTQRCSTMRNSLPARTREQESITTLVCCDGLDPVCHVHLYYSNYFEYSTKQRTCRLSAQPDCWQSPRQSPANLPACVRIIVACITSPLAYPSLMLARTPFRRVFYEFSRPITSDNLSCLHGLALVSDFCLLWPRLGCMR